MSWFWSVTDFSGRPSSFLKEVRNFPTIDHTHPEITMLYLAVRLTILRGVIGHHLEHIGEGIGLLPIFSLLTNFFPYSSSIVHIIFNKCSQILQETLCIVTTLIVLSLWDHLMSVWVKICDMQQIMKYSVTGTKQRQFTYITASTEAVIQVASYWTYHHYPENLWSFYDNNNNNY